MVFLVPVIPSSKRGKRLTILHLYQHKSHRNHQLLGYRKRLRYPMYLYSMLSRICPEPRGKRSEWEPDRTTPTTIALVNIALRA